MKRAASNPAVKILAVLALLVCVWLSVFNIFGLDFLANHGALLNEGIGLEKEIASELLLRDVSTLEKEVGLSGQNSNTLLITDRVRRNLNEWFHRDSSNFIYTIYDENGQALLQNEAVTVQNAWISITKRAIDSFPSNTISKTFLSEEEALSFEKILKQKNDDETKSLQIQWDWQSDGSVQLRVRWYPVSEYRIQAALRDPLTVKDRYYYSVGLTKQLVNHQRILMIGAALFSILSILLLIFLIIGAGRSHKTECIKRSWTDSIPIEIYAALMVLLIFLPSSILSISNILQGLYYVNYTSWLLISVAIMLVRILLSLWLVLSFSRRCKARTVLHNSLIVRLLTALKSGFSFLNTHIEILWKLLLFWTVVSMIEAIGLIYLDKPLVLLVWGIEKLVIFILGMIVSVNLYTLEKGGADLRAGNLETKLDLRRMIPVLRRHGENLNGLGEAMKKKVDENLRGERLKAELVTNVSHDIKTPLTSIINYVDLLKKEGLDSENAEAYLEVLDRQSAKLKKLVTDLVEASKASTGNVSIAYETVDVNLLLSQAVGEYDDRMNQQGITPVIELTTDQIEISADPKLLWRIFDNLLNNALKYSQIGTRIYLTTEIVESSAKISISNVSKEPLNISPEELMERFVRGDSSRNTDGSGLGLSIARNLTELQGGIFGIKIDGDLFKVVIRFPIKEPSGDPVKS